MSETYDLFKNRVGEVHDLGAAMGLMGWDQEVYMPDKGVAARARHRSTLAALIHDRIVDPGLGELITRLQNVQLEGFEAANVAEMKRQRDRSVRIPRQLVADLARETTLAQQAWVAARKEDRWELFSPHLSKLVDLKRQEAEAVGYETEAYDALLDEYEPGAQAAQLADLFTEVRQGLVPLLADIVAADNPPTDALCRGDFSVEDQDRLGRLVLANMGFDFESGRLDISTHPFTEGLDPTDVRITTRYQNTCLLEGLYSNLHEGGHALYEMGLPMDYAGQAVGQSASLGIHESQSRLWENLVGRSANYMNWLQPQMAEIWPSVFGKASGDDLWRAVNVVQPSLIRTQADEVTYNLHIILRMEIERALIAGEVEVAQLPSLWREKVRHYLDLDVPSDTEGVLQDIHWSFGLFGYFPTYALGNLYASQFFAAAEAALPDLGAQISAGQTAPLLAWLREKIHSQGLLHQAGDLCRQVTGQDLSAQPFLTHLRQKFGQIYHLNG